MNPIVKLTCPDCAVEREYNYIKGYIYGWPHCNGHRRMLLTGPIEPGLKDLATDEAYVPPDERVFVVTDAIEPRKSDWKLRHKSRGMK